MSEESTPGDESRKEPTSPNPEEVPTESDVAESTPGVPGEAEPSADDSSADEDEEPHHALSNPAEDPDPTEWPDPYDKREDPRDAPGAESGDVDTHTGTGALSTSEPHPSEDPEAGDRWEGPKRDKLDD
jgi:hypothetical protein